MNPFKKTKPELPQTAVDRRIAKMSVSELVSWADQSLFGIGRCMSDWQRFESPEALMEARMGAEALYKVLDKIIVKSGYDG